MVGKALALIHARPSFGWTIEGPARQCGTSRSVMADASCGSSKRLPMQISRNGECKSRPTMLRRGNANMATIAAEIGYEFEAAFSRAFKKI